MRFDLSDEEWALLEPLLPKSRKSARVDDRKIVNAIFYVLRTGMPWRDLLLNSSTVGSTINARKRDRGFIYSAACARFSSFACFISSCSAIGSQS